MSMSYICSFSIDIMLRLFFVLQFLAIIIVNTKSYEDLIVSVLYHTYDAIAPLFPQASFDSFLQVLLQSRHTAKPRHLNFQRLFATRQSNSCQRAWQGTHYNLIHSPINNTNISRIDNQVNKLIYLYITDRHKQKGKNAINK